MKKAIVLSLFVLLFSPVTASAEEVSKKIETENEMTIAENNPPAENQPDADTSDVPEEKAETVLSSTESSSSGLEETTEGTSEDTSENSEEPTNSIENDASSFIEEQTGSITKADRDISETSTASEIRDQLLKDDSGITKDELDSFSDKQLENTNVLFYRMMADMGLGFDSSSYVTLLNGLYKNSALSWEDISKQMAAFNPSNFNSFTEMINYVNELQAYLKTLYPSNSSFIPVKDMSNEELINLLKYLQTIEDKMMQSDGALFPGRMAYISQYSYKGIPVAGGNNEEPPANNDDGSGKKAPVSHVSTAAKKDDNGKGLPQTNEKRNVYLTVIGSILLAAAAFIVLLRRKAERK